MIVLIFIANTLAHLYNNGDGDSSASSCPAPAASSSASSRRPSTYGACSPSNWPSTHLAPLSIFADVVDIGAMGVVMVEDVALYLQRQPPLQAFGGLSVVFYGLGVAVYAFEGIGMVLPLESEAANKAGFGRTLGISMALISLMYALFGVLGYFAFGDDTRDIITTNLGKGVLTELVQLGLCVNLFFTFPLMMNPVHEVVERTFAGKRFCLWLRWASSGSPSPPSSSPTSPTSSPSSAAASAACWAFFFLPGSVVERSGDAGVDRRAPALRGELGLDFGEGIRFVPSKLLERFEKESAGTNSSFLGRPGRRAALLKPLLALVLPDLSVDATQLYMVSVAVALQEIGYGIHVYALEDGPVRHMWSNIGLSITILPMKNRLETAIDWLNYNGILLTSLEAKVILSCLLQEPFKSVPVIWTVHEGSLALRLNYYMVNNQTQLIHDWKQAFNRATVVVFPNYALPIMYSVLDPGNFFVIPGSPSEAWKADNYMSLNYRHDPRVEMGYRTEDFLIAIVGSQFSYSGLWLEHALVLQAIAPLRHEFSSASHLKVAVLSGNSTSSYKVVVQALSLNFGYSSSSVVHFSVDEDVNKLLVIADVVIYGSFLEEQSFPSILIQAMCLGKPILAPDLAVIRKNIDDGVNGFLFPREKIGTMTQILSQVISNGKLSLSAQNVGSVARVHAKNLMVSETIEGYASLLEHVIKLPSEVASPKTVADIPLKTKKEWQWHLFENLSYSLDPNKQNKNYGILDKLEEQWNVSHMENAGNTTRMVEEAFSPIDWAEEKLIEMINARKRLEEEELKDRTDQPHGTWEEVYRNAKRADRAKNELHERDDRELERTGQPLCIYEPYFGQGTWPFLHNKSLYRGIGLSTKGRRPRADDIDASSRLPILNDVYYRDVLGEYGAFFALANRIDRIHKNSWIGFQSWRAAARKAFLSKRAESVLLESVQSRKHGDSLYFWVRMDKDHRNPQQQDFWSFCDSINAGNCRFAVSEALRRMYGVRNEFDSLPPMPTDGDTWSVMHCWALPTRSFLEFVMFARMFVDALDAQIYEEHHQSGHCYLSLTKDRHCYSRVLELLVNVWAYHSARRMIYIDAKTGVLQEHHRLKSRRGHMWVRWFSYAMLKSMDEDLAEKSDSDHPDRRWLWPSTGEVFWQGVYERERNMRHQQKERRKRQSKDKIQRIKKRARQKTLGKYVKPPPEDVGDSNSTVV